MASIDGLSAFGHDHIRILDVSQEGRWVVVTSVVDDYRDAYIRRMDEKVAEIIVEAAREGMYPFKPGHVQFSLQNYTFRNILVVHIESFDWEIHIPQEEVLQLGFEDGLLYIYDSIVSGCRNRPIKPREDHILLGDN